MVYDGSQRDPKGHNCFAHGRWLWLKFVGESILFVTSLPL
jgi:hypothetical protein